MTINREDLKKKIIYRSTYRGSKEMDTLLSSFTKKYINTFNYKELIFLSDLLDFDDVSLYKFHHNEKINIDIKLNKVTELFKNFIYKNN